MITTEDTVLVLLDSIELFVAPQMVCFPSYNPETEVSVVDVSIRNSDGAHIRYTQFEVQKVDIDAASISASDNTDKWMEAIQEVVKLKLEGLNPGATFTIS